MSLSFSMSLFRYTAPSLCHTLIFSRMAYLTEKRDTSPRNFPWRACVFKRAFLSWSLSAAYESECDTVEVWDDSLRTAPPVRLRILCKDFSNISVRIYFTRYCVCVTSGSCFIRFVGWCWPPRLNLAKNIPAVLSDSAFSETRSLWRRELSFCWSDVVIVPLSWFFWRQRSTAAVFLF